MNVEEFSDYCLAKKGVEACFPFDEHTLVMKVMGKMFAVSGLNHDEFKVNLKCEPEYAMQLRDEFDEIQPGWHMNKTHWNTVNFEGDLSRSLIKKLIDHSYELVVDGLTKKKKEEWRQL